MGCGWDNAANTPRCQDSHESKWLAPPQLCLSLWPRKITQKAEHRLVHHLHHSLLHLDCPGGELTCRADEVTAQGGQTTGFSSQLLVIPSVAAENPSALSKV
ncbi:WD repeat-containing protein 73 [Platysternon megacephalum]|uniref:WD repeat-containing protein 73 n=1 Tax=Platysternon megacephalum TaxID=55544 RepID=A0A4D9E3V4_9SAUR|nr:WD repeat-containing protein 73 [Platysternon megacephalum]